MSRVKKRSVKWLWRDHIPLSMLSLVAGRPEKGKSLFTIRVAADVSHEYAVILSSHEDQSAETVKPRLEAAGANMKNVHEWRGGDGIDLPRDLPALRSEIERLGVALVVLDPIASHTRQSIYNTTAIREGLAPIRKLAKEYEVAFLLVHHVVKRVDLKADPLSAVGGAGGGLSAMVRVAYLWGDSPDDPDERLMVQLKCNVAKPRQGLRFELDVEALDDDEDAAYVDVIGKTNYHPSKVFQASPTLGAEKMEAAAEWLVAQLREGPMSKDVILAAATDAEITRRMVGRVVDELEVRTTKSGKWKLPKEFPSG